MTWEELAAEIAKMPLDRRKKLVRVLEPYDNGAAMLAPDTLETYDPSCRADEPLPDGDYYLA